MLFDSWWYKLNVKRAITSDVRMNPEQFRNMLKQAYDAGHTEGREQGVKAGMDLSKLSKQDSTPDLMKEFMAGWTR